MKIVILLQWNLEINKGDKIYSIDNYVCPLGTEAVIYYDKDTGELLKITTRTIL